MHALIPVSIIIVIALGGWFAKHVLGRRCRSPRRQLDYESAESHQEVASPRVIWKPSPRELEIPLVDMTTERDPNSLSSNEGEERNISHYESHENAPQIAFTNETDAGKFANFLTKPGEHL